MTYENFIALRYLMAKRRSRVVSVITMISVAGVALGVTAMIVVLSVMGGFKKDLKEKILGAKAHVVVKSKDSQELRNPERVLEAARSIDDVVGASPFIEAEVMASSPTNLNGVVLRGINPETIGQVSDLDDSLEGEKAEGKLEYLTDPAPLMERLEEERESELGSFREEFEEARERYEQEKQNAKQDGAGGGARETFDGEGAGPNDGEVPDLPEPGESGSNDAPEMRPIEEMESTGGESSGNGGDGDGSSGDTEESSGVDMPSIAGDEGGETDADGDSSGGDEAAMPSIAGDDGGGSGDDESTDGDDGAMPSVADEGDSSSDELPGILIGKELAKSLQVELGSEINVVTPQGEMGPTGPIPRSRPFQVVGIFYTGMYEYDANNAYTSLQDARDFLDIQGVSGVELKTTDVDKAFGAARTLESKLPDSLEVLDWKEMNRSLFYALKLEKIAMFVVLTFIILVASFSIIAMLIMIVLEKKRDISVLKSMGMTDSGVMRIFIYQGVAIGAIGAAIGLIVGLTICFLLVEFGFPLDSEVYYISTLPVEIDPVEISLVVAATILISLFATIYPSRKASKLRPVEGLRYE